MGTTFEDSNSMSIAWEGVTNSGSKTWGRVIDPASSVVDSITQVINIVNGKENSPKVTLMTVADLITEVISIVNGQRLRDHRHSNRPYQGGAMIQKHHHHLNHFQPSLKSTPLSSISKGLRWEVNNLKQLKIETREGTRRFEVRLPPHFYL